MSWFDDLLKSGQDLGKTLVSGAQQAAGNVADVAIMGGSILDDAGVNMNPFISQQKKQQLHARDYANTERLRNMVKNTQTVTGASLNPYQDYVPTGDFGRDFSTVAGRGLMTGLDATMFVNPSNLLTGGYRNMTAKQALTQTGKGAGLYGGLGGVTGGLQGYGQTGDVNQALVQGAQSAALNAGAQGLLGAGGYGLGRVGRSHNAQQSRLAEQGISPEAGFARIPGAKTSTPKQELPLGGSQRPAIESFQQPSSNTSTVKLNTKRLGVKPTDRKFLDNETTEVIERLSNAEVKELAKASNIDFKSYGVAGTKKKIQEQLNLRNEISTVAAQARQARNAGDVETTAKLYEQAADMGRVSRSQGTDIARQLQARRIIADQLATPEQKLFRVLDEAGVDPKVYTKRLAEVDMTNPQAVIAAYREMVPAKFSDWLDKFRYTNMLSSPLTHAVNISSNVTGIGGIAPIQKLYEGVVDNIRADFNGAPRTRFASEAGAYVKGTAKSLPEAMQRFKDVMTGKQTIDMPDAEALKYGRLAVGGAKGAADNILSFVPKLLEASDQFGMTLSRGGERASLMNRASKGAKIPNDLDGAVDAAAKYRVFRQELGAPGQGVFLEALDEIPKWILQGRNSKNPIVSTISKFTIPFVTTPVNLFKQGIEYSPAGVLTMAGHADKTGQAAKALMGTTVMALTAGALASKGDITFSEPSDAKQRDAFRAEGKQPYAVKIGDKWVGYSKLHPAIAFNLAVVGAIKDAEDRGAIDQPAADRIMQMAGATLGYFRDQSYMKSVGDFTSNLELKDAGDLKAAGASMGGNYANQLMPFKSMVSWIGRQIDPTQRKVDYQADVLDQIYQKMVTDIPGLNQAVPFREDPYNEGQPIKNDNPTLNAFSPLRITNDKGYGKTTGLNVTQRKEQALLEDFKKEEFRQGVINDKYTAKLEEQAKADEKKASGDTSTSTGKKTKINAQISGDSKSTLKKYDELDTAGRNKLFDSKPDAEFKYEAAKYENDLANGTLSKAQAARAKYNLAKSKIGSTYARETRDLYGLTKQQIVGVLSNDQNGKAMAEKILAYGDALAAAGFGKNKFRDKYGNVAFASSTGSGGRKGGGKGKGTSNASLIATTAAGAKAAARAKVSTGNTGFRSKVGTGRTLQAFKKPTKTTVRTA